MVSSEGLVRGIDRTLEYAEYTEEERPVSIQIFGGDPEKMAAAAQIVEGMGADIVDVNMGCPVPKIAKHNAGCSLMREPAHAQAIVTRDDEGGEDPGDGEDARRLGRRRDQRAGSGAPHGRCRRRGGRGARPHRGAVVLRILRLGSDRAGRCRRSASRCSAAATASSRRNWSSKLRWRLGVGRARRPRRAAESVDLRAGGGDSRAASAARRSRRWSAVSSCSTTSTCCCSERTDEAEGFRHVGTWTGAIAGGSARRAGTIAG